MRTRMIEFCVGLFMIVAIIALVFLAIKVSGLTSYSATNSYFVTAKFNNIGGLKVNAPVRMAGVKIGQIMSITLDRKTFQADVKMAIFDQDSDIPSDSSASILTEGILGANYVSIAPGYSNASLHNGSVIEDTHPALVLENLIGQLLFSIKDDKKSGTAKKTTPTATSSS